MTTDDATPPPLAEHRVTFPDLVRIHYRWRADVGERSTASLEERALVDDEYHAALARFEEEHGQIVSAYWCADFESAVALTAGKARPGRPRRALSVAPPVSPG